MTEQTKEEIKLQQVLNHHTEVINQIRELDNRIDSLSPFELSKLEYLYSKAERQAWNIAGYYKKQYKYYEGMAEISQGTEYKKVREDKEKTATDGQYMSRIMKGQMLCSAAEHEGDFLTWKGVAGTYERAANSIKDMIKAIKKEGDE